MSNYDNVIRFGMVDGVLDATPDGNMVRYDDYARIRDKLRDANKLLSDAQWEISRVHTKLDAAGVQSVGGDRDGNEFCLNLTERLSLCKVVVP